MDDRVEELRTQLSFARVERDGQTSLPRTELESVRQSENQAWEIEESVARDMWWYKSRLQHLEHLEKESSEVPVKERGRDASYVPPLIHPPGLG
eukprot:3936877-Amphidinium_carterae.1